VLETLTPELYVTTLAALTHRIECYFHNGCTKVGDDNLHLNLAIKLTGVRNDPLNLANDCHGANPFQKVAIVVTMFKSSTIADLKRPSN
jgi:hypothetical protein